MGFQFHNGAYADLWAEENRLINIIEAENGIYGMDIYALQYNQWHKQAGIGVNR